MANTAFDTLETAENLEAAGVDTAQAKAHAREMAKASGVELASKADIAGIKADLYRAIWTQAAGFAAFVVAVAALAVGLMQVLP